MNLKDIGRNIREERAKKKWTQEKMAEVAECSWRYVQMVEQGRNIPSIRWLNKLAEKTRIPLKRFFD
jgi:transcriptional regulator with XRE-family HTH domain